MRKSVTCSIMTLFCFFFAVASFAKEPKCDIRKLTQSNEKAISVPVTIVHGRKKVEPSHILFEGIEVSATFIKADSHDPHTSFQMRMGDVVSNLDEVTENTRLPNLRKAYSIIFQCWFE